MVGLHVSRFGRGRWRSRGATGGKPSPSLASAASRRVGPCTRSAVVIVVAELYRGARSSERERYARPRGPRKFALANFWGEPASRLGAQRPSTRPTRNCHHTGTSFSRPGITKWVARP